MELMSGPSYSMTILTTSPWPHDHQETGAAIPEWLETENSNDLEHGRQEVRGLRQQLAENFEMWYAQKRPTAECNTLCYGSQDFSPYWMYTAPESDKRCKVETLNPDSDKFDEPGSRNTTKPEHGADEPTFKEDWSQGQDLDQDFAPKKIKSRKWKFSTPPPLSGISEKHMKKIESQQPARKMAKRTWSISWGDEAPSWPEAFIADDLSGCADDPRSILKKNEFETIISERTWVETQLLDRYPELKKYHPYAPSLLRRCCTVTTI